MTFGRKPNNAMKYLIPTTPHAALAATRRPVALVAMLAGLTMATPCGMAATASRQAATQWLDLHHFLGHQPRLSPPLPRRLTADAAPSTVQSGASCHWRNTALRTTRSKPAREDPQHLAGLHLTP